MGSLGNQAPYGLVQQTNLNSQQYRSSSHRYLKICQANESYSTTPKGGIFFNPIQRGVFFTNGKRGGGRYAPPR